LRQREHGGGAGGVVVGAVVDGVAGGVGGADAEVVQVCGEQDDPGGGIGAAQDGDGVLGCGARDVLKLGEALAEGRRQRRGQRDLLQEGAIVAARGEAEGEELRGGEECGDVLVASGGAAAVELIVGEEGHVGVDFAVELCRRECRLG
jgi:hypothetical protein